MNFSASASTNNGGSWLSVSPGTGGTPGVSNVSVNGAGLAPGTHTGSVTIVSAAAANSPQGIPVVFTVTAAPTLVITPGALFFSYQIGSTLPPPQTISIAGVSNLNFSASAAGANWLSVTPVAGTAPASLAISVNPAGFGAGTYSGTVTIIAPGVPNSTQTVSVTLAVSPGAAAVPTVAAIMNAATFLPGSAAPGQIVTIFGAGIGPVTPAGLHLNPGGLVDQTLACVRVLFDGVAAPMIYASATMVSAIVPYTIEGRFRTRLLVEFQGTASPGLDVAVAAAAPGIFTMNQSGGGQGAILNQNYSVNSAGVRAAKGSVVMIFGTGEGQTNPAGVDGLITGSVLRNPLQPVSVTIGGQPAEVLYAGSAPGLVAGVLQVNARVPDGILSGDAVPVVLTIGSASSPSTVTMAVQ